MEEVEVTISKEVFHTTWQFLQSIGHTDVDNVTYAAKVIYTGLFFADSRKNRIILSYHNTCIVAHVSH